MIGPTLSSEIEQRVKELLDAHKAGVPLPEPIDFIPDNLGEVAERMMIEHIRAWHIEDSIGEAFARGDDAAVVAAKRKLETCWKVRRPRLLAAFNRLMDDAIVYGRSVVEGSVKIYKGYE
jgi:hypothetical protein